MRLQSFGALSSLVFTAAGFAQSTVFTYQGALRNGGQPASGQYDLQFRLFDTAANGTQLGATLCADNVSVADGSFYVELDFGQQFRTPNVRHLEVSVRADTGQPCAEPSGFVVLLPRQPLTPAPLSLHASAAFALDAPDGSPTNAVFVDNDGKVGIGTASPGLDAPSIRLDIEGGSIRARNLGDQADLVWLASERSWVFRQEGAGAGAALKLQSIGGGGNKNFIVQTDGNVGIGTMAPASKLHVVGNMQAQDAQFAHVNSATVTSGASVFSGLRSGIAMTAGRNLSASSGSVGVLGAIDGSFGTSAIGVKGVGPAIGDVNCFGVFSTGRLGASGTKSFRIDHPENPENVYLFHYCAESPEVINFYRGTVNLDDQGRAVVTLPSYFSRINTEPSYQLTAVGAPMPMLHVSVRISERAMHAGALLGPSDPSHPCWFAIDGGAPGGEVSWRVEAVRNDEFVRRNGAPVEVEKPVDERGTTELGARNVVP